MALTFSPTTMRLNTRSRSRSREHTGRSLSRSRSRMSREHTVRSRSRSTDSEMARFAAGGRTCRRNTHISSSDDVQNRGGYLDTMSHSSDSGHESRRQRRRFSLSNSSDGREQSPHSPFYGYNTEGEEPEIGNSTESDVVLSEPDVLDCPICLDPLSPPVYQCRDGHLACGACSSNNESTCPSCRMPIVYRCRGIEQVLESAKTPCRNREHGCMVTISYSQKFEHEKSCEFNVCSCPQYGCNYVGIPDLLYTHFSVGHSVRNIVINYSNPICLYKDVNQIFLQESHGSTLFVLNRKIEPLGSLFNVVCVAPTSFAKYTYKLTSCAGDRSICLKSYVDITPKFSTRSPEQNCLLITNDFADEYGSFQLQLRIGSLS